MPRIPETLLSLALFSSAALAATPEQQSVQQQQPFAEKGSYLGLSVGPFGFRNAPGTKDRSSFGEAVRLDLRFNLIERVAFSVFVMGSVNRVASDYVGFAQNGEAQGDFTSLSPGAALRLNLIGSTDTRNVRRVWVYVRAGGGYAMFWPKKLIPDKDFFVFGSLGIEYRTHLRHFSIGLEATPAYYPKFSSWSGFLAPNVQFAF
jgi:hypothetical protein